uniref:ADP-ribosylation factor-like protein 2 n=1 Tax=Parascaris equorum TaxID=6256 RepID=A0A914RP03_PAREQ
MWDVGGQKSIRSYWRNYFEQTDCLIWVVDSADIDRMEDCKRELKTLLTEERLIGASLLVLANKQDLPSSVKAEQIEQVGELQFRAIRKVHTSSERGRNGICGIEMLL